jgi:hypothetical protein
MAKDIKEFFDINEEAFNDELMTFQDENDFEPVIEIRPRKLKIKHKFYIAS